MNKKLAVKAALLFFLFVFPLSGQAEDWRSELASRFLVRADWSEITSFLEPRFNSLEETDKPTAALILAFAYNQAANRPQAYLWIARFFEDFRAEGVFIDFLDHTSQNELWAFLRQWQARYPLLLDLAFITPAESALSLSPPDRFILAIQMANSAFFKLMAEGETLKAGLLQRGLNTLSLESSPLIRESGAHAFLLDLKADDLIVRREINIEVNLSSEILLAPTSSSEITRRYRLSLFLGNKLLAQSQKTIKMTPPVQFTLPPADGRYSPYGPVHPSGQDPNPVGVSILSLPAVIAQLIKDYKAKREEKERIPPPEIKKEIQVVYLNQTMKGLEKLTADLKLGLKGYQAFVFSTSFP